MRFHITQNSQDGLFIFQLIAETGEILLTSQSYPTRDQCVDSVRTSIEAMAEEENFDSRAEAGGYVVVLITADGSELGRSQIFDSEDQADETIESIVEDAATQEDYKVTITSTTTTTELTPLQLSGSEFITLEERYDFNQLSQSG